MVATMERPSAPAGRSKRMNEQPNLPQHSPGFPLSSPVLEIVTALKPSNITDLLETSNPFFTPNPFTSSSSSDDSGNSSGQDEFHLERYSQDAKRMANVSHSRRNRSVKGRQETSASKSARRPRPGLNIVTNFSTRAKRSQTDGLVIDKVHSRRPQIGPRYATSIVSAKAEHIGNPDHASLYGNGRRIEISKVERSEESNDKEAGLKLQDAKSKRKMGAEPKIDGQLTTSTAPFRLPAASQQHLSKALIVNEYSPEARSILIGLSVPENEADAHRLTKGLDSAASGPTPDTPAIVVTPAEDGEAWKRGSYGERRPTSGIYSIFPQAEAQVSKHHTPPVPKIPQSHLNPQKTTSSTPGAVVSGTTKSGHEQDDTESEFDDERGIDSVDNAPRPSFESQEPILSTEYDAGRPRSQGWWNLMLSPMLSRKGTIVDKRGTKRADVPPVPAAADTHKSVCVSSCSPDSPMTPRRLGLAEARASVWSRWSPWQRERSGSLETNKQSEASHEDKQVETTHDAAESLGHISRNNTSQYYHACAVEQLSGGHYFECQNHSCTERLPQLQSVFDCRSADKPSSPAERAARPVDGHAANGSKSFAKDTSVVSDLPTLSGGPEPSSREVGQVESAQVPKDKSLETPGEQGDMTAEPRSQSVPPVDEAVGLQRAQPSPASEGNHPRTQYPNVATVMPAHADPPTIMSPGPISPEMQENMVSRGAVPMTEVRQNSSQVPPSGEAYMPNQPSIPQHLQPSEITIHNYTTHVDRSPAREPVQIFQAEPPQPPPSPQVGGQSSRRVVEREEPPRKEESDASRKPGFLSKLWGLLKKKRATPQAGPPRSKRHWTLIISIPLFLVILTCLLLALLLTRSGDGTPAQSQWLNLTGYPPIPTGISTIARPDAVKQQSQCVAPATLWSCSLPKESQAEIAPNNADQPNFRFSITFKNGTVPANMTVPVSNGTGEAGHVGKRAKDPFTNDLFEPNPEPPSRADQIFMGNTTDNITQPFEGEATPFFITFIPVFPADPSNVTSNDPTVSRFLARRATNSSDSIPAPDVLDDGSAAPANLLPNAPYPTSQPIKLYNRGQADEHYGFYMYYDKAIFLKSTTPINTTGFADNGGVDPEDENGGSPRSESKLRCTFSQTRFLVRMWTNPAFGATLLAPIINSNSTGGNGSSATNFNRPGSFPYPTTLSVDRHGGNINKKAVYCYGVDDLQVIQTDVRSIVPEARGLGGTLINPAPPLVNGTVGAEEADFDPNAGGIDGGTGGCECIWQNWN
ncbi:hypothetical protein HRR83_008280 [Exophiala dermatitidis]|nr:hypothetical protein HRR73_007931 [Exophiala dermatitidis]KAJ4507704.1 hypothetical protein HRR74_008032 [Exophiala dermatitidis]KAJ4532993.1 hypothetical protein HRR76_007963 [Exophiala dermatitidis]KAJ4535276.1 hypothetical protein HRR77_008187 [Exophiala dermatitidis]KAJ4560726.1 hypothetical protein HRR79_007849 [Exophiala dermatitidis]